MERYTTLACPFKIILNKKRFSVPSKIFVYKVIRRFSAYIELLSKILNKCSLVGVIDSSQIVIQFEVNLMIIFLNKLSFDLFYQIILKDYGNFGVDYFKTPINIRRVLLMMQVEVLDIDLFMNFIVEMKDMLKDYFSIIINKEGCLCGLPVILQGYKPNFKRVFILISGRDFYIII